LQQAEDEMIVISLEREMKRSKLTHMKRRFDALHWSYGIRVGLGDREGAKLICSDVESTKFVVGQIEGELMEFNLAYYEHDRFIREIKSEINYIKRKIEIAEIPLPDDNENFDLVDEILEDEV
jgi:hypothetical protein